jgi:site-specific DNA-cytosine methylase
MQLYVCGQKCYNKESSKPPLEVIVGKISKATTSKCHSRVMSHVLANLALIAKEDLQRLGRIDLVMGGWPCQRHSRVGLGQGLQDLLLGLFSKFLRLLRWWQCKQSTMVAYIFENVPPMEIVSARVCKDAQVLYQHLGELIVVALESFVHRLR